MSLFKVGVAQKKSERIFLLRNFKGLPEEYFRTSQKVEVTKDGFRSLSIT